jgi:hypothetical protein
MARAGICSRLSAVRALTDAKATTGHAHGTASSQRRKGAAGLERAKSFALA